MKSYVKLSGFALMLTVVTFTVMGVVLIKTFGSQPFAFLLMVVVLLLISGLLYAPIYVEADDKYVSVKSPMRRHCVRMDMIESVESFKPTMGAKRLIGSGGFMGYWGVFWEGDVGRYCAYYGKSSDCILIRMKTGDKYVVGCQDVESLLKHVTSRISPETI